MTDLYSVFGKKLRKRREALGLTQSEVADRLGLTRSAYTHYEAGTRCVLLHHLAALATIFGLSLATLAEDFPHVRVPAIQRIRE